MAYGRRATLLLDMLELGDSARLLDAVVLKARKP